MYMILLPIIIVSYNASFCSILLLYFIGVLILVVMYLSDNADSQNIIGTYYLIGDALGACII